MSKETEALRALLAKATPGPWKWVVNLCGNCVHIESPRWLVMDFVRWGMDRAAPGQGHHADWHRIIKHPNAELMVAAVNALPSLLDTLERREKALEQAVSHGVSPELPRMPERGEFEVLTGETESDEAYERRVRDAFPYGENTVEFFGGDECMGGENCPELAAYLRERAGEEETQQR